MGNNARRRRSSKSNNLPVRTHQPPQLNNVTIVPKNVNQETYMLDLLSPSKDIVVGVGPAGTGKTMLAVQVAIKLFRDKAVDKIIITRPVVSVDEDIGFLPGTLEEKMGPWTIPIIDVFKMYYCTNDIRSMLYEGIIEMAPLAYMRGRTLNNSFIIVDESQNTTKEQMKMVLTRMGFGSNLVINGDLTQIDLPKQIKSGLSHSIEVIQGTDGVGFTNFSSKDVVRHPLVKKIIDAYKYFEEKTKL